MKKILNYCFLILIPFSISCEKKSDKEPNNQKSLPEISSNGFSSITLNSVFCKGEVLAEGVSSVIHRGFCWNNTMNPTIKDSKIFTGSGTGIFETVISGLTPNTTYYVRAFAINSADTVYSTGMKIKTYTRLITDIDGNKYYTVSIGSQEWMAENLKVTHFRNGEPIPIITSDSLWNDTYVGSAMCYYNNDNTNSSRYGALYNGKVIDDVRNVCPEGWHIPSENEFDLLISTLGGEQIAGRKIKDIHWDGCGLESNNESSFTALGAGWRRQWSISGFHELGSTAAFWSSTGTTGSKFFYRLVCVFDNVDKTTDDTRAGHSIRCIKD